MKEITRRLYTRPVMLGLAFLAAAVLLVGLFVTARSSSATQSVFIEHGDDSFETTGNGESFHNFAASPIPAGFFGPGSDQYTQSVPLVGVPLQPLVNDIDTIIHRNDDVWTPGNTSLTMTALNLKSINNITVTYGGSNPESWSVRVNLSDFKSSTGSMSINSGGTFDSSLKVWPKFTFTRVSDGTQRVLDTGSGSGLMAFSSALTLNDGGVVVDEPVPMPAPTIAPCAVQQETQTFSSATVVGVSDAAATSSCPPVTLTSTNSPWQTCNGKFCIPRPITEQELLASHNASPPGTKRKIAVKQVSVSAQ
jgi:hypothetical protein